MKNSEIQKFASMIYLCDQIRSESGKLDPQQWRKGQQTIKRTSKPLFTHKTNIKPRAVDPDPGGENLREKTEKMQGKWKKIVILLKNTY